MANNINVEIGANVGPLKQGMTEAQQSLNGFETQVEDVAGTIQQLRQEEGSLRRQQKEAMKTVMELTAAYNRLEKEGKLNTVVGKELTRQLQQAEQEAANMIDATGDLSTKLKNMASDTATFDVFADGLSGLASTMSAVVGTMGIFTNNTEQMQKAVTMFTTAESIAAAAIKVKNLLQKESSLMLGIGTIKQRALTAATKLDTTAKSRNAIAAGAATVAQKAFNAVANANPYVLLGTAILAVATAFITFSSGAEKATESQNKLSKAQENAKKIAQDYSSNLISEYSKLMGSYSNLRAQWKALSNNSDRKKFIEEHKAELESLGGAVNSVADAEAIFGNNTGAVVQSFIKRAQAAAIAAKMVQLYSKQMEIEDQARELQASGPKAGDVANVKSYSMDMNTKYNSRPTYNGGLYYMDKNDPGVLRYTEKGAKEALYASNAWRELNDAFVENQKDLKSTGQLLESLYKTMNLVTNKTTNYTNSNTGTDSETVKNEISTYKDAVAEYDKLVKEKQQLQELITSGRIDAQGIKGVQEEIKGIEDKINNLTIKWHIKPELKIDKVDLSNIIDIIQNGFKNIPGKEEVDFSYLNKYEQSAAQQFYSYYKQLVEAKDKLIDIYTNPNSSKEEQNLSKKYIDMMSDEIATVFETINAYRLLNNEKKTQAELDKKHAENLKAVGDAMSSLGSIGSSLGEIFDDEGANVAGIIAQAVANYILGWTEATKQAAALGPIGWVGFGLSTAAQMLAMVAQIKSAAQFAEGGIVGGHSYYGDKILARLNSKEMILNEKQQRQVYDWGGNLDTVEQAVKVQVTGKISGKDLLLVQKNTNKILSKSGQNIEL